MKKPKHTSLKATIGGFMTTLAGALVLIDWDSFDLHNPKDIIKGVVVIMPAIGGWFSETTV